MGNVHGPGVDVIKAAHERRVATHRAHREHRVKSARETFDKIDTVAPQSQVGTEVPAVKT